GARMPAARMAEEMLPDCVLHRARLAREPQATPMFPRNHFWLAALVVAAVTSFAIAHDGPLDPRFGDGGMRNYGFQPFNGSGREDVATAVCQGPNGTLLVVGEASDARRIVTMRLLPNGD